MTLIASPEVATLGSWIEQLVAESTGKQGKGVVPIDLEPFDPAAQQGNDRAFVYLRFGDSKQTALDVQVAELVSAGLPVATLQLTDRKHRWRIRALGNGDGVRERPARGQPLRRTRCLRRQEATGEFIAQFESAGALPRDSWVAPNHGNVLETLKKPKPAVTTWSSPRFSRGRISATSNSQRYGSRCGKSSVALPRWATAPRFLHSTGQLHKGGPNTGVFILLQLGSDGGCRHPGPEILFRCAARRSGAGRSAGAATAQ